MIQTRLGRDAARDQFVRTVLDLSGVEQRDVDVEIEPRLVGRDVPAGDRRDDDAGHHVQRRVQAHERVTARPVDFERYVFADFRKHAARGDKVCDRSGPLALARVRDRDALAVFADEKSGVARLAAAERIEDRAVELDLAVTRRDDARRRGLQVRIVAEQQFGRHCTKGTSLLNGTFPLSSKGERAKGNVPFELCRDDSGIRHESLRERIR